jgi:uncharacterized protein YeaO (DUF488 family)
VSIEVDPRIAHDTGRTVDTEVDRRLDKLGTDRAAALLGSAAIANARLAYQRYEQATSTGRRKSLEETGARPQRPLWASTGVKDPDARLDAWAKDVAPSAELRRWYGHDPPKFGEFRRRYTAELDTPGQREALARLRALAADGPVTPLTATRDLSLSQAAVLAGLLQDTT